MSEADFAELPDFASLYWADGRPEDLKSKLLTKVIYALTDLEGDLDEPFPKRSRARFAGPLRLAFSFDRRPDPFTAEGSTAKFSLQELLDWDRRDQVVVRRAQGARRLDASGHLVRTTDQGELLRLQGFTPDPQVTAAGWMAMVYAAAKEPPADFDTAIEIPFRLQLSPAHEKLFWLKSPVISA